MTTEEISGQEMQALLGRVDFEVRVIRDVSKRLAGSAAPKFSIFDFVRTDELGLSACLAALLNPKGAHGQGSTFLRLFMETLDLGEDWFDGLHSAHVRAEAPANGMRRLDIHVQLPDGRAIAIENKPWAIDQNLQLADYASFLERTCRGGWKLVYISDRLPAEESIAPELLAHYREAGCLKLVTFQMLADWLARCGGATKPIAVRVFLEHMEQFIRKRMCGEVDMSESETIKDIVLGSPETLRAAILVGKTIESVKKQLLARNLRAAFEKGVHDMPAQAVWDEDVLDMRINTGFGVRFASEAPAYLRYEFEGAELKGLFWGIRRSRKLKEGATEHPAARALVTALEQAFGRGGSSAHWFWYCTDLRALSRDGTAIAKNWATAEAPWMRMQKGTLAEDLLAHVRRVREVVEASSAAEILGLAKEVTG